MRYKIPILVVCLIVLGCSLTTSIIALLVELTRNYIPLLLFIVAGFLISIVTLINCIILMIVSYQNLLQIIIQILASVFYVVTGVYLIVQLLAKRISFHYNNLHNWDIIISIIFMVNIVFMALSLLLIIMLYYKIVKENLQQMNNEEPGEYSEASSNKTKIRYSDEKDYYINPATNLENNFNIGITKKMSEKTLIGNDNHNKDNDDIVPSNEESAELDFILKKSMEMQHTDRSFLDYNNDDNWMSTGLNSISFKQHLSKTQSSPDLISKSSRFGLFAGRSKSNLNLNQTNHSHSTSLANSKSTSNLIYDHSHTRSINNIILANQMSTNNKSNNNRNSMPNLTESNSKLSLSTIYTDASLTGASRSASLLISHNCSEHTLSKLTLNEVNEDFHLDSEALKRSKSTSYINTRSSKSKQQTLMSINGERNFLSQVNESLLPSVLKSSESPIMKSKRKQEASLNTVHFETAPPTLEETIEPQPPLEPDYNLVPSLSPVGEVDDTNSKHSDHSFNIPYGNEFDEPIDQSNFADFDASYNIPNINEKGIQQTREKKSYQVIKPPDESYPYTLNGLEKIPKSTSNDAIKWNVSRNASGVNNITLDEWNTQSNLYQSNMNRGGANLSIPGLSHVVSDHNLKLLDNTSDNKGGSDYIDDDMLLPRKEGMIDNIDNLSDIHTSSSNDKQGSLRLTSSSRSYSAPSLYTFRDYVEQTNNQKHQQIYQQYSNSKLPELVLSSEFTLKPCRTPEEDYTNKFTVNTSPMKMLIESPKRVASSIRRQSRRFSIAMSNEPSISNHKHKSSVASNFSTKSATSSRSGSPRKSLRSLMTSSKSHHRHNSSVPTFSLSVPSLPKKHESNIADMYIISQDLAPSFPLPDDPSDFWELDTNAGSERSRISSLPSAVIGEYDKEKWRTLKALENKEKLMTVNIDN
ncbi:hypothetical protein DFJ63DRAFT_314685 [Scheffersomyces coipomensis]|uniref:uncharacterized protein n=1 Tax=Scheffersomyces coipomensis TaxID=1788519 RepID=UPI00315DBC45